MAAWIRSVLPRETLQSLEADVRSSNQRQPVDQVHPDASVGATYAVAADIARRADRQTVARYDVALALALVPGAHTRYLMERESLLTHSISRNAGAIPPPRPSRGSAHSFLDGLAVLLRAGAAGAILVFFGAGLILRRGLAHMVALVGSNNVGFASVWNSNEHGLHPSRVLSFWGYVRLTLLVRASLFAIGVAILFRIMLEMRGLGFVPWPALTSGARELGTGDVQTSIGAEILLGSYALQIWIAAGAAFYSMPSGVEVSRIRQWSIVEGRLRPVRALLVPLDLATRLASRFDGAATWLGAPVAVASGFVSLVAAVLLALLLVWSTLAVAL